MKPTEYRNPFEPVAIETEGDPFRGLIVALLIELPFGAALLAMLL
jgi:hypothetical protein